MRTAILVHLRGLLRLEEETLRWTVETLKEVVNIEASDQWEAYDSLRDMPVERFGILVVAMPEGGTTDDSIAVRTSMLMFRWGRRMDAHLFLARAMAEGLPDTSAKDDPLRNKAREREEV